MTVEPNARTFEFLSPGWFEELGEIIAEEAALTGVPGGRFTLCEVITDVPGRGTVAWHCHVREGAVEFARGIVDDADHRLTVHHAVASVLARTVLGDPDGLALATKVITEARAAGRFSVESSGPLPRVFAAAHDRIARLTTECGE